MIGKIESRERRRIKLALAEDFRKKNWRIECIDGESRQTNVVKNEDSIGDEEDKRPDIDAKNLNATRIIRGEAKIDNGDFSSEHSTTQYKLFSNLVSNHVGSWLIIGVPMGTKRKMEEILDEELNEYQRSNVAIWEY